MSIDRFRIVKSSRLILAVALFLALCFNLSFFQHALEAYPFSAGNIPFLVTLFVLLAAVHMLLLGLVGWRYVIKPLLVVVLLVSSLTAYFMDTYNVVIDDDMIQNVVKTDIGESADLLSARLLLYFIVLGVLPSVLIFRARIDTGSMKAELISKLKIVAGSLLVIVVVVLVFGKSYSSFFREHKTVRFYANPTYAIYSAGKYISRQLRETNGVLAPVGRDARIPVTDMDRELIVLVVGETARADRFSLNGYARETNPLLKKEDVISFTNVHSCGTSTAVSVPCMFSAFGHGRFTNEEARSSENLLDVLTHAGINVLWRDNNSDSKGVALRVPYENFKQDNTNTVCDEECRDEGMLVGLQEYVDGIPAGDIVIVLHQMGNHGPAYYKRYPKAFEKFTPVCTTSELDKCSLEEIGNAYDNAILYTDYFLSKVIAFLKGNNSRFETAMVYVSDHGESLGEKGLYLHGMPNFMAPEEQTHVPAILWLGDSYRDIDREALGTHAAHEYTHDNFFHTVLGLVEVESSVYRRELDLIHHED